MSETLRDFLDRMYAEQAAFEARWMAVHAKTVAFLAPIIRKIIEKRKSRRNGHPGGGRAARRRGRRYRAKAMPRIWPKDSL